MTKARITIVGDLDEKYDENPAKEIELATPQEIEDDIHSIQDILKVLRNWDIEDVSVG